jgi:alpha-tubulin suppressor-like RCC1 family protein
MTIELGAGITLGPGITLTTPSALPPPPTGYALWSVGLNNIGELGYLPTGSFSSPNQVGSLTTWTSVWGQNRAGATQLAAVTTKNDGTLWIWGGNSYGQLGLSDTANRSSPVQLGSLTTWASTITGQTGSWVGAVNTNGTLWTWGRSVVGSLGQGDNISRSSPTQVGALTTWLGITGMYYGGAAVRTDGTLWTWGQNNLGQLGLGNTTYKSSPTQVGTDTNWLRVTAGYKFAIAQKTNGSWYAWGKNAYGSLGLGDKIDKSSPVQIGGTSDWSVIYTGGGTGSYGMAVMGLKSTGTLWSWGVNNQGQLGLNDMVYRSSPVQIGAFNTWSMASPGSTSMAVKTNGTLWGWGLSNWGQLGLNDVTKRSSPTQVGALTNWNSASTATNSSFMLKTS